MDGSACPHCDGAIIQNEQHIIFTCRAVQLVCTIYNVISFADLARPSKQTLMCLKLCLKILEADNDSDPLHQSVWTLHAYVSTGIWVEYL